jgi:hypothetical protein
MSLPGECIHGRPIPAEGEPGCPWCRAADLQARHPSHVGKRRGVRREPWLTLGISRSAYYRGRAAVRGAGS